MGASDAFSRLGKVGQAVATSAVSNVVTQGVSIAVGLQDKFSWRSVAASAVTSALAPKLPNVSRNAFVNQVVKGIAGGAISQAIANRGKVNFAAIAADSFGNALGSSILDGMQSGEYGFGQLATAEALNDASGTSRAGDRLDPDHEWGLDEVYHIPISEFGELPDQPQFAFISSDPALSDVPWPIEAGAPSEDYLSLQGGNMGTPEDFEVVLKQFNYENSHDPEFALLRRDPNVSPTMAALFQMTGGGGGRSRCINNKS